MNNFTNKIAVITGAANGIGKAIAKKCLQLKMQVVLADIDKNNLAKCHAELKTISDNFITVETNVADAESVNTLANITFQQFGKVHLLFNNAGIIGPVGPIWETDVNVIQRTIDINIMGMIHGLRAFIPHMLKQTDESHIINTSSGAGLHTSPNISSYTITKHSVTALTEALYYDLKQRKIDHVHVSLLCPGFVKTNFINSCNNENLSPDNNKILATFKQRIEEHGIAADDIVEKIFTAIENKQFYILTHPEHKEFIKNRFEDILHDRNPSRNV